MSWEGLAVRHVETLEQINGDLTAVTLAKKQSRQTGRYKKDLITDPGARNRRLEPAYKQHAVVDNVIIDVEVTTGETNERQVIIERIDAAAGNNWDASQDCHR